MNEGLPGEDTRPVTLPSGALFYVYPQEVAYFQERVKRYTSDNHFTNVADFQDIDRMLIMELLCWRWGTWISQQTDYWKEPTDPGLARTLTTTSAELRALKKALGIDKETRDKQRGEDSVAAYVENLRIRAREFGVMREKQLDRALELFNDLKRIMTLHDNSDTEERHEQHVEEKDVFKFIREHIIPEFDEVDAHFREHTQKMWIREQ